MLKPGGSGPVGEAADPRRNRRTKPARTPSETHPGGRRGQSMEPRRSEKSAVSRSFAGSSSMATSSPSELHRGMHQFG